MLGRIHIEKLAQNRLVGRGGAFFVHGDEQELAAAKKLGLARDRHDVGMAGDRPERRDARALITKNGRLLSQQRPFVVRIAALYVEVGIEDVNRVEGQSRHLS
jgi:hypothetical protein